MLRAVIFDCDGVLFDSWRANLAFYNTVLKTMGLGPMEADWERRAHVMASAQLFEAMFGADASFLARVREVARGVDYGPFYELMEPVEGLHHVLAELKRSYLLAIASNRGRTLNGVVERFGLGGYLDHAAGVSEGVRPKPHPDLLVACLESLAVRAAETVFVGDSTSDLEAARAAGVHFVAVGGAEVWAEAHVSRLVELPSVLRRLAATWADRAVN
jgi:phosphoglycolate phosphatase